LKVGPSQAGVLGNIVKSLADLVDSSSTATSAKQAYISVFGTIILSLRLHLTDNDRFCMVRCIRKALAEESLMNSAIEALQGYKLNPLVGFKLNKKILEAISEIFSAIHKIYQISTPSVKIQIINIYIGLSMIPQFNIPAGSMKNLYKKMNGDLNTNNPELAYVVLSFVIERDMINHIGKKNHEKMIVQLVALLQGGKLATKTLLVVAAACVQLSLQGNHAEFSENLQGLLSDPDYLKSFQYAYVIYSVMNANGPAKLKQASAELSNDVSNGTCQNLSLGIEIVGHIGARVPFAKDDKLV
jgi:hypothetical protein